MGEKQEQTFQRCKFATGQGHIDSRFQQCSQGYNAPFECHKCLSFQPTKEFRGGAMTTKISLKNRNAHTSVYLGRC